MTDNNPISHVFTKNHRLLTPCDFKRVFDAPAKKIHSEHLLLFVRAGQTKQMCPRLGLAITKKKLKQAVMRNRLKRLTREYFRLHCSGMEAVDVVLIVKKKYTKDADLHGELTQIFKKLIADYPALNHDG